MQKNNFIIWLALVTIVVINVLLFRSVFMVQVNQQKNLLFKESSVCSQEIEQHVKQFENDLNYILYSDDVDALFNEEDSDALRKIQFFYSTYHGLVKNIDIYDNNKNVLNIFRNKKKNFITDSYIAQRQRKLIDKERVNVEEANYLYMLPVFKDSVLFANILVSINFNDYILSVLNKFHLEGHTWQWVTDLENNKFYNTQNIEFTNFEASEEIIENLENDRGDLVIHNINNDSLEYKLLTVYNPIKVLNKDFGIAMSVDYKQLKGEILTKLAIINILSLLIFIGISFYLIRQVNLLKKKTEA